MAQETLDLVIGAVRGRPLDDSTGMQLAQNVFDLMEALNWERYLHNMDGTYSFSTTFPMDPLGANAIAFATSSEASTKMSVEHFLVMHMGMFVNFYDPYHPPEPKKPSAMQNIIQAMEKVAARLHRYEMLESPVDEKTVRQLQKVEKDLDDSLTKLDRQWRGEKLARRTKIRSVTKKNKELLEEFKSSLQPRFFKRSRSD